MEIDQLEGQSRGFGSFGVTVFDDVMISMRDGIKLSVRIWFPSSSTTSPVTNARASTTIFQPEKESAKERFGAIVEYLPYRKNDYTSERDHRRHPWMTSHGFVVLRVDMRGSGW